MNTMVVVVVVAVAAAVVPFHDAIAGVVLSVPKVQ
jgi:hypothetical protein